MARNLLASNLTPMRSLRRRLQVAGTPLGDTLSRLAELAPGPALLTPDRAADAPARSEASLAHYAQLLADEAAATDLPANLLEALCWHASGWRQFEPSGRVLTTPTPQGTSYGCMQLSDVWHPDAFPAAMTDAQASIRYAAKLLAWLLEQTAGDAHRAVVAFFGHDRRAELAARRVDRYVKTRPWKQHHPHADVDPQVDGLVAR